GIVERARDLLKAGWESADLAKLTQAKAEGQRADGIARSGGASASVQQEALAFRQDALERLERAEKDHTLTEEILDVSYPQEMPARSHVDAGRLIWVAQPGWDEQSAGAFRRWGLDGDKKAEDEVVARLDAEPGVMVQQLIAALDNWMLERRRWHRPEAEWRRLFNVANRLDHNERHRQLRALLVGGYLPRAEGVAGLAGAGSCWLMTFELGRVGTWRQIREVRREIDPRTEPVLTVLLLANAYAAVGDATEAEQVLLLATA